MRVVFYLLGLKGFRVLVSFLEKHPANKVVYVMIGCDKNIKNDYSGDIKKLCVTYKIRHLSANEDVPLSNNNYDIAFAVGWQRMIVNSEKLVILHDSPLPRYRGFAPLVNMLVNGESKLGVTALKAAQQYDQGDILASGIVEIRYPITINEAIEKIIPCYESLVKTVYDYGDEWVLRGRPQNQSEATYSMWLDGADYRIDWRQSAKRIRRFVDAVGEPYAGAQTCVGKLKVRILEVEEYPDVVIEARNQHLGKVIFVNEGNFVIVCGEGLLQLKSLVTEGGDNSMDQALAFRSRFS